MIASTAFHATGHPWQGGHCMSRNGAAFSHEDESPALFQLIDRWPMVPLASAGEIVYAPPCALGAPGARAQRFKLYDLRMVHE